VRARATSCAFKHLDHNPLHLIERDHIGRAIVELGRPRALVGGHGLSVLSVPAGLEGEVGGDAYLSECIVSARLADCRAEQGSRPSPRMPAAS